MNYQVALAEEIPTDPYICIQRAPWLCAVRSNRVYQVQPASACAIHLACASPVHHTLIEDVVNPQHSAISINHHTALAGAQRAEQRLPIGRQHTSLWEAAWKQWQNQGALQALHSSAYWAYS